MKWLFSGCSNFYVLLCAVIYTHISAYSRAAAQGYGGDYGDCNKEQLIRCFNPLAMMTDENKEIKFVTNKEELDRMCPELNAGLQCVISYTKRCMNQEQQDQFHSLYRGTNQVIRDVCIDGPYQKEYLRHAPCVQKVRSEDENCAAKYQRELRDINQETPANISSPSESAKNVQKVCCSLQTYLECSENAVLTQCGAETAAFTKSFLDTMASSLIQTHCEKYPPGSVECLSSASLRLQANITQLLFALAAVLMYFLLHDRT